MTLTCHPEAQPKDLANEKEILRFAQNDSFAVNLAHFRHFSSLEFAPDSSFHTSYAYMLFQSP